MPELIIKMQISTALVFLAIAFAVLLLRRSVFWVLLGLSLGVKGIILASLAVLQLLGAQNGQSLILLSFVALGLLMIGLVVSLSVMIRVQRFSGEMDWDRENVMRH